MPPPSMLPRLCPTRTLGLAAAPPTGPRCFRGAPAAWSARAKADNSIPFAWGAGGSAEPDGPSTITPSEASVFRGIFDEISQGRRPTPKKWASRARRPKAPDAASPPEGGAGASAQSIVEQARAPGLREQFLLRYPHSLREAAVVALGLYELEPQSAVGESEAREWDDKEAEKRRERLRHQKARDRERLRITALIKACQTDVALWQVMEDEVFSLPRELGILQKPAPRHHGAKPARGRASGAAEPLTEPTAGPTTEGPPAAAHAPTPADDKRSMDIHGPLYPMLLNLSLVCLDRAYARSSPLAYQILPRVKELGLLSYVLGASTPFYSRLARMHWHRFGDAATALDLLQEMSGAGLQADDSVHDLLAQIRHDWHACAAGPQGPFVAAVVNAPPYGEALTRRLTAMEGEISQSLMGFAAEQSL